MKEITLNRILTGGIVLLSITICVLIAAIVTRPHYINETEPTTAVIEEAAADTSSALPAEEETAAQETTAAETQLRGKTSTRVNIRDAASDEAKVLETVDEGYEFDIIEVRDDGWTSIKYGEETGYISSLYVILIK